MGNQSGKRKTGNRWRSILIAILTVGLLLVSGAGVSALARQATAGVSIAEGHAAVIAQGVESLPNNPVNWRVTTVNPTVTGSRVGGSDHISFIVGDQGTVLVTDRSRARTMLAPGEAIVLRGSGPSTATDLAKSRSRAYLFELVDEGDRFVGRQSDLVGIGDPFTAAGDVNISLVRDVLQPGEQLNLEDTDAPFTVLNMNGTVRVEAGEQAILRAGETGSFTGDIAIKATGSQPATVVVAVVSGGPNNVRLAPPATPTATPTSVPTPTPAPTAVPRGSIGVLVYGCPPGITLVTLEDPSICYPDPLAVDMMLFGQALPNPLIFADAQSINGGWVWSNLSLGEYTIEAVQFADPYNDYFVPGSAAVGGTSAGNYSVNIDSNFPDITLAVYLFQPEVTEYPETTGQIMATVYACPIGMSLQYLESDSCEITMDTNVGITFIGGVMPAWELMWGPDAYGYYYTGEIGLDTYLVEMSSIPYPYTTYFIPGSAAVGGSPETGYTVTLDSTAPNIGLTIFLLAPN